MKTAIICFNCKKMKKESESYAVRVVSFDIEPTVIKHPNGRDEFRFPEKKVRVCRPCAKRMGYKVKKVIKKNANPTGTK